MSGFQKSEGHGARSLYAFRFIATPFGERKTEAFSLFAYKKESLKTVHSSLTTSFLYYQDKDRLEEEELALYRQGMAAFGGIAPTYHIEHREKPVIVWDFHSLSLILQMMLSFMIADESPALKICKKCGKAFLPARKNGEFCSARCKNQYNVYKTRAKKQQQ